MRDSIHLIGDAEIEQVASLVIASFEEVRSHNIDSPINHVEKVQSSVR